MTEAQVALWIQVAAVLIGIGAAFVALVIGALDRRHAREVAARDRRFQRLMTEHEFLGRLLENYGRGGSSDPAESKRMGSEALSLIGLIGCRSCGRATSRATRPS